MTHIKRFNENLKYDEVYKDGDRLKCMKDWDEPNGTLVNGIWVNKVQSGDILTISIEISPIDSKPEYYLIDSNGKKLMYPYKKIELQLYFRNLSNISRKRRMRR